jgi:xanthine dehydrogenase/oxidase
MIFSACCQEIKQLIKPIQDANPEKSWEEIISLANKAGTRLFAGAQASSSPTKPNVYDYFVYAACCSEVEVDILTGEVEILASEIVYDCGISLNPAIDIGQIEGAFVMALGLYLQEEVVYSEDLGELLSNGTWEYKVPCIKDIPQCLKVTLLENANNKNGVLSSKATGEPPFALAMSAYFAAKNAILDSRRERGENGFFHIDVPATVARRQEIAKIKTVDLMSL